jgi:hypothetical protein
VPVIYWAMAGKAAKPKAIIITAITTAIDLFVWCMSHSPFVDIAVFSCASTWH